MKLDQPTRDALTELEQLVEDDSARKVSKSEWSTLDKQVADIFPKWYRELMGVFRLAGVDFEVDTENMQLCEIRFTSPDMVPGTVTEISEWQYDFEALASSEYFPLAWYQDGNILVTHRSGNGEVAQFEATCLDGKTFVAALADSPSWPTFTDFVIDLIPAGYEG